MSGTLRTPTPFSDTTDLDSKRNSLSTIIGNTTECPLRYFLDSLLPAPSNDAPTIQTIKEKLDIQSKWSEKYKFPEPKKPSVYEDETFETLSTVLNDVNRVCNAGRNPVIKMIDTPNQVPCGEQGTESAHRTRPDSCFMLCDSKSVTQDRVARWNDIAMTWEYKKRGSEKDFQDVCAHLLGLLFG
jgi:hypothetical protein